MKLQNNYLEDNEITRGGFEKLKRSKPRKSFDLQSKSKKKDDKQDYSQQRERKRNYE